MRLSRYVQALAHLVSIVLAFGAVVERQQFASDNDDDPPLPATIEYDSGVDAAQILQAPIAADLFQLQEPTTAKRAKEDTQYTISFTQNAITESSGHTLYGLPVNAKDLRTLLQRAIGLGATQDSKVFSSHFNSSVNSLTLAMTAVGTTPGNPTFNRDAYAEIAKVLLAQTTASSNELPNSWVGVVKNRAGAFIAKFAVIPRLVVVHGSRPSPPSPLRLPTPRNRLIKRDIHPIPDTPYRLTVRKGIDRLAGFVIEYIVKYAYTSLLVFPEVEYSAFIVGPYEFLFGRNTLTISTPYGRKIEHHVMVQIVRTIHGVVEAYSRRPIYLGRIRRRTVKSLQGEVINAQGDLIAKWTVGGPLPPEAETYNDCAGVLVEQPDGGINIACAST